MAKLTMSFMHPAAAAAAIVTCIVATAIVPSASARESPPPASTAPDSSANNSPSSPLAGPNTGAASNPAPSLVHRDFTGRVVRPETPIEVLALEGLGLSPADRARVDEILGQRARDLEVFVLENIETLGELYGAVRTSNTRETIRLILRLAGRLPPSLGSGTLQQQLADVLPAHLRDAYNARLEDYWLALIDDDRAQRNLNAPRARWQALAEDRLQALGKELAQAFERTVASGDLVHRIVTRDLGLTPDQNAAARDLAREFQEKTGGNPTQAQGASYVLRFMAILTPEQRTRAIRAFRDGQMTPERRPAPTAEKAIEQSRELPAKNGE
ncbi:MAG: hypothetical protein ACK5WB_04000 [Phycisphaerales bacterium]|jgi:hypothetical protein|nr:hypothetical protein [Phycisphaeraceae bacterium]